jgi:hypothetical protein
MKVGILTFHRAENFGASLQVYALQQYLKSLHLNAIILDYRCMFMEHHYDIFNPYILFSRWNFFKTIPIYMNRLSMNKSMRQKHNMFQNFRQEHLKMSGSFKHIKYDLGYDAYIVGSDQIWRPMLTNGVNDIYFLNFPMAKHARCISYAASAESTSFPELRKHKKEISIFLNQFNAISVREKDLQIELSSYTQNPIKICVDPTFLLSKLSYEKLAIHHKLNNYILVYHLFETHEGSVLADKIAQKERLRIVEIHSAIRKYHSNNGHIHIDVFGPQEMLGWIIDAKIIITTSFHGLVLSLILQKNVWIVDEGQNNRLSNLLKMVHLERRMISDSSGYHEDDFIDYLKVNDLLQQQINYSKNFLKVALNINGK